MIFSNPCNPTSKALCAQDVEALIADCPQTLVVLDEAYMDFWEESLLKKACCYENLVILRTASKAVGAAALRLALPWQALLLQGRFGRSNLLIM